jgi:Uma2 family endonuclease
MTVSKNRTYLSTEEYLAAEQDSPIKHEYIQGQVYAMAGASDAHVTVAGNLFALLRNHLRGTGCRVYMADMKTQIESANVFYYPDVMVTCDARDKNFTYFKRYPCLIVEVLSPTTEAFDRGNKFADYRRLETLQEYVLINPETMSVECFRRNSEGLWVLYPYSEGEEVRLASVYFAVAIANLYEDVPLGDNSVSNGDRLP